MTNVATGGPTWPDPKPQQDPEEAERAMSRNSLAGRLENKANRLVVMGKHEHAESLRKVAAELRSRTGRKPKSQRTRTLVFGPNDFVAQAPDGQIPDAGYCHGV